MRFQPAESRKVTRLLRGERLYGLQRDAAGCQELWRLAIKTKETIRSLLLRPKELSF
jgi:hypothetical protein